jgi:fermentation-respiration switch protein FrsA (DUF1100 family)
MANALAWIPSINAHGSDQAYALSKGPKELFVVEGATHIAMYDVPEYVDQAVFKMVRFFAAL